MRQQSAASRRAYEAQQLHPEPRDRWGVPLPQPRVSEELPDYELRCRQAGWTTEPLRVRPGAHPRLSDFRFREAAEVFGSDGWERADLAAMLYPYTPVVSPLPPVVPPPPSLVLSSSPDPATEAQALPYEAPPFVGTPWDMSSALPFDPAFSFSPPPSPSGGGQFLPQVLMTDGDENGDDEAAMNGRR